VIPLISGSIATILFLMQGGFGGGHLPYDRLIGYFALPSVLLFENFGVPTFAAHHDIVLLVWGPAVLNSLMLWLLTRVIEFVVGSSLRKSAH
jgi:hypothetical protein